VRHRVFNLLCIPNLRVAGGLSPPFPGTGRGPSVGRLNFGHVFFSGFIQFWGLWSLAGVPWLLLILLKPLAWWRKALLFAWLMPATALAHPYPPLLIDLALAALVLMLATGATGFVLPAKSRRLRLEDRDGLGRVRILRQADPDHVEYRLSWSPHRSSGNGPRRGKLLPRSFRS